MPLSAFGIIRFCFVFLFCFLDFHHSNRYAVVSHCFNFFGDMSWKHLFICLFSTLCFLWCSYFAHFKSGCLLSYFWFLRILCIFWLTVLYQICLSQIFSLVLWLIFSFSLQCLYRTEVLMPVKSSLSIIFFISVSSKKSWPNPKLSRFFPMLSS